ncbi:MBL fold metallo-hydrolase [Siminovitchia fortis]|uniref:MBL fold metallo-hydrolase n=1 Tax=Siminovitchia fortis TaxID=254758 RepID=A0A443J3T0_9BACI|nr:MBL fold metallo-hydrolase [Siminovitchia fortis]RWR15117.1 MBL fold metallo-hydrolase [Siminovitchia fortis]WHY82745.1 MBL fold metallo-hydrolase [Siminovitchia fortis]
MKWKQIPLGPLQTNCYLLFDEEKQCIVIDPGANGEGLIEYIEQEGLKPLAICLTHAHFDHIGAVEDVRNHWNIPVYIHENEKEWLLDPSLNGSARHPMQPIAGKPADHFIQEEGTLSIGPFTMQILETPGHSPGSVSYYLKDIETVFSGDALFNGGIGRTDLLGGDHATLIDSIHSKLLTLPDHTIVLPGHGLSTTIEDERTSNPYL